MCSIHAHILTSHTIVEYCLINNGIASRVALYIFNIEYLSPKKNPPQKRQFILVCIFCNCVSEYALFQQPGISNMLLLYTFVFVFVVFFFNCVCDNVYNCNNVFSVFLNI